MLSIVGFSKTPPKRGQSSPKILKRELFPHPFGPDIIKCMPGSILKLISLIKVSPLGDKIGTFSNTILEFYFMRPRLFKELSMS